MSRNRRIILLVGLLLLLLPIAYLLVPFEDPRGSRCDGALIEVSRSKNVTETSIFDRNKSYKILRPCHREGKERLATGAVFAGIIVIGAVAAFVLLPGEFAVPPAEAQSKG